MADAMRVGLLARIEAKPGKEKEVETFLRGALSMVEQEPQTVAWFGIRMGPTTFGIFDAFSDESGRQAHLNGKVAAALMASVKDLLVSAPAIEKVEILASTSQSKVSGKGA